MRFSPYHINRLLFIIIILACTSCKEIKTQNGILLNEAQQLADDNPKQALALLDSIDNPATTLDKDHYMQYIVLKTYTQFSNGIDISNDTLILTAVDYFEKQKNEEQLSLAYLYAGNLFHVKDNKERAFKYFVKSYDLAKKNKQVLIEGKSLYNMGFYFTYNNMQDSALVYYEKSLKIFKQIDKKKIIAQNLFSLAKGYYMKDSLDIARKYGEESLALSTEIEDKTYQYGASNQLGMIADKDSNYNQALQYYKIALQYAEEDTLLLTKTTMNIANVYIHKNRFDSAALYAKIVEERIPIIKDLYTLRSMTATLYNYYTGICNYKLANQYGEMRKNLKTLIDNKKISAKIYAIDKERYLMQYKEKDKEKNIILTCIGLSAFMIIVALFIYYKRKSKHDIEILIDNIKRLEKKK